MVKSDLIGFCGRKRSGKSSLSNMLRSEFGYEVITVASYLKKLCCDILEVSYAELNRIKDDGTTFEKTPDEKWCELISQRTEIPYEDVKKTLDGQMFTNVRDLLQFIGTDLIRKYNETWHIDCMVSDIRKLLSEGKKVTVDDVRFPNERKAIEDLGGECFFVVRPRNDDVSNHISERSLMWQMFDDDKVILNCSSISFMMTSFKHYLMGVNDENRFVTLLSDIKYISREKSMFGIEHTDLVDEILRQNRDLPSFIKNGVITYKPVDHFDKMEFLTALGCEVSYFKSDDKYVFVNPLINENLKQYL